MQPMLGHSDRDRRQLGDLTPRRLSRIDTIGLAELVRTRPTSLGPILNDLVDALGRESTAIPTLVPLLPTRLTA